MDPFVELNEIAEMPGNLVYRQVKSTGRSLRVVIRDRGLECRIGESFVRLDASQRRELTEWLHSIPV